jgi:integrase
MAFDLIKSDRTIQAHIKEGIKSRLSDGSGLYLIPSIHDNAGSYSWRFDYTFETKRKTISLGIYPSTGLASAREKAIYARELVASGKNPSDIRKAKRQQHLQQREAEKLEGKGLPRSGSFEEVARRWFSVRKDQWAASYGEKVMRRLENDVFPFIGKDTIEEITPRQLLEVMRRIERRGVIETAHRALESCSQVFRFAVHEGEIPTNPARDLKGALKKPVTSHFAAITNPQRLGELLRAIQGYQGTTVVRAALQLQPMLLLRPGELRFARWPEIDLSTALWTVPPERMKRDKKGKEKGPPHLVALPTQAAEILLELQKITGQSAYVFRGERHHDRPMSENSINAALRALGFSADEVTGHGFRATARTMLAERLGVDAVVIEAQLDHSVPDSLGRSYNRTQFLEQRSKMLQMWANYLERLRNEK